MRQLSTPRGFSLIELMVAITISGILMCAGLPSFVDYLRNVRLREAGNALLAQALFAQSEAVKRNTTVTLATQGDAITITVGAESNPLDRRQTLPAGMSASTASIAFSSTGRPPADAAIDISGSGITCSSTLRCPALRVDAGGGIRLCGDRTSCS